MKDSKNNPLEGEESARERYIRQLQELNETRLEIIILCKERIERLEKDLKNQQNWQYINYN